MSVVAVKKYDEYIEICADGLCIWGQNNTGQLDMESCKLKRGSNYIIGDVGSGADADLFNNFIENHKTIKGSDVIEVTYSDLVSLKIQFYKDVLIPNIHNKVEKEFDERVDTSSFILVLAGKAYVINSYGVMPITECVAIGAGSKECLSNLINGESPIEVVKKCAKSNVYISDPITAYRYYFKDGSIKEVKVK